MCTSPLTYTSRSHLNQDKYVFLIGLIYTSFLTDSKKHVQPEVFTASYGGWGWQHTATHCNTLQHTATHCNTLQHTATHCNTLQRSLRYSRDSWRLRMTTSTRVLCPRQVLVFVVRLFFIYVNFFFPIVGLFFIVRLFFLIAGLLCGSFFLFFIRAGLFLLYTSYMHKMTRSTLRNSWRLRMTRFTRVLCPHQVLVSIAPFLCFQVPFVGLFFIYACLFLFL